MLSKFVSLEGLRGKASNEDFRWLFSQYEGENLNLIKSLYVKLMYQYFINRNQFIGPTEFSRKMDEIVNLVANNLESFKQKESPEPAANAEIADEVNILLAENKFDEIFERYDSGDFELLQEKYKGIDLNDTTEESKAELDMLKAGIRVSLDWSPEWKVKNENRERRSELFRR